MMDLTNVEWFDLFAARALAKLYESFPLAIDFEPALDLIVADGIELPRGEVQERGMQVIAISEATIRWLVDEDFVRVSMNDARGRFFGCVLTSKGLSALRKIPPSVDGSKVTVGDSLRALAGTAIAAMAPDAVKAALANIWGA